MSSKNERKLGGECLVSSICAATSRKTPTQKPPLACQLSVFATSFENAAETFNPWPRSSIHLVNDVEFFNMVGEKNIA